MNRPESENPNCTAQPPLPFQVRAIVRALQRLLDHPLAALERLLGLEQRRNLDAIVHPEQPRIVKRRQQREPGFRLRNQKPDGRLGVDVLDDLRHRHHQPLGRRPFLHQRFEADRQRPHAPEQIVDGIEVRSPIRRIVRLGLEAHQPPRRVVQLRRVEPHMNMRQAHAMRPQARAYCQQRFAPFIIGRRYEGSFDQREHRRRLDQRMRAPRHHRAAERRRACRIALGGGQQFDLTRHGCARRREHRGERFQRRQEIAARRAFERVDFAAIAFDHRELVGQTRRDRPRPCDIGAPVLVVSDPRRQRDEPRFELGPILRPVIARDPQRRPMHSFERVMRMVERLGHPCMFDLERQFGWRPMIHAAPPLPSARRVPPDRALRPRPSDSVASSARLRANSSVIENVG